MNLTSAQLFSSKSLSHQNEYIDYLNLSVGVIALSCLTLIHLNCTPLVIISVVILTRQLTLTLLQLALRVSQLSTHLKELNTQYRTQVGSSFSQLTTQHEQQTYWILLTSLSVSALSLACFAIAPFPYTLRVAGCISMIGLFSTTLTQLAVRINKLVHHLKSLSFNTEALSRNDLQNLVSGHPHQILTEKTLAQLAHQFAQSCDQIPLEILKDSWYKNVPEQFHIQFKEALTERVITHYLQKDLFNLSPTGVREETDLDNIMEGDFLSDEQKKDLKNHVLQSITEDTNPNAPVLLMMWLDNHFTIFEETDWIPTLNKTLRTYYNLLVDSKGSLELDTLELLVKYNIISPTFTVLCEIYEHPTTQNRKQELYTYFNKSLDPSWEIALTFFLFQIHKPEYDSLSIDQIKSQPWPLTIKPTSQELFKTQVLDRFISLYLQKNLSSLQPTGLREKSELQAIMSGNFLSEDHKQKLKKWYLLQIFQYTDPEKAFELIFWMDPNFETFSINDQCLQLESMTLSSYAYQSTTQGHLSANIITQLIKKNILFHCYEILTSLYNKTKDQPALLNHLRSLNEAIWNQEINRFLADHFAMSYQHTSLIEIKDTQLWNAEREDRQVVFKEKLLEKIITNYINTGLFHLEEHVEHQLEGIMSGDFLIPQHKELLKQACLKQIQNDDIDPNNVFALILLMDSDFTYFQACDRIVSLNMNLQSYAERSIANLSEEMFFNLIMAKLFKPGHQGVRQRYDQLIIDSIGPMYLDKTADPVFVETLIKDMEFYASPSVLALFIHYLKCIERNPEDREDLILKFQRESKLPQTRRRSI